MTAIGSLSVYIVPYEIRETRPDEKPESREGERRILDCSFQKHQSTKRQNVSVNSTGTDSGVSRKESRMESFNAQPISYRGLA